MRRSLPVLLLTTLVALVIAAPSASGAMGRPTVPVVELSVPGARATSSTGVSALMTAVLTDVDAYWTRVFEENDLGATNVRYRWIPAGRSVVDGCSGQRTSDDAAFYCPADDTIYVSEAFAGSVRDGSVQGWPSGDRVSSALGDMAVAYMVAHEEAHNVQAELGLFDGQVSTRGLELHADCLAGAWAGDAAERGVVDTNDAKVAQVTAWLVGDYAFDNPGHHGTPKQRRAAFANGFRDLGSCRRYLAA